MLLPLVLLLAGCASPSGSSSLVNPSFPLTAEEAKAALRDMRRQPRRFERPVVIASGYLDPGPGAAYAAGVLRAMTPDDGQVVVVPFFSVASFEACRTRLIEMVQERFPSDDPARTVEVDVIGVSMGGLIARDAAAAPDDGGGRVLAIHRLFTIATPHGGADGAHLPTIDPRVVDMRAGSPYLRRLDVAALEEASSGDAYPIVAYTRLDDEIVGTENTIPPRGDLFWLPNEPLEFSHLQAQRDERILADIARRLRGERPFANPPATPLPE